MGHYSRLNSVSCVWLLLALSASAEGDDLFDRPILRRNVDGRLLKRSHRQAIPDRDNGFATLVRLNAAERQAKSQPLDDGTSIDDELNELMIAFSLYDNGKESALPDDFDSRVQTLAPQFDECFPLLSALTGYPHIRIPDDSDESTGLYRLREYLQCETVRLCRAGRSTDAFDLMRELLTIPGHTQSGDITAVSRTYSRRVWAAAHMMRLSRHWHVDDRTLVQALQWLDEAAPPASAGLGIVRQEFAMGLPGLSDLPDQTDLDIVILAYLYRKAMTSNGVVGAWKHGQLPRLAARVRSYSKLHDDLQAVFVGHPNPYDLSATLRLASNVFVERMENENRRWFRRAKPLSGQLKREVGSIATRFQLGAMSGLGLLLGGDYQRPEPGELERLRTRLARVDNAFGKLTLNWITELEEGMSTVQRVQRMSLIRYRTALALHAWQRRHGYLPATLDRLVSDGLLQEVPEDLFGDRLHYSPDRALIWSNGRDGINHGGVVGRQNGNGLRTLTTLFEMIAPPARRRAPPPPMPESKAAGVDRVTFVGLRPKSTTTAP